MDAVFLLDDWQVIPSTGQLRKGEEELRLEPKSMAVLVYMAERAGNIVTREELEQQVWRGTVVTYEALSVTINKLRSALGDNSRHPRYIETLPKRGYRLIASVRKVDEGRDLLDGPRRTLGMRLLVAAFLVALLVVSGLMLYPDRDVFMDSDEAFALPGVNLPSIAVIPFANNNGVATLDYFAAGITEYLITDLSRHSNLLVTSRNSVLAFNSQSADIGSISEALGVQYVVTGSVLKSDDRVRVAVQLTDAGSGVQLWANRFDRKVDDLLKVQDAIIEQLVTELLEQVGGSEQVLLSRNYTRNIEAHDYFIRGNALYTSISKEGNSLAREMFLKAIEIDPRFASAYGAIALTYVDDYRRKWGDDPDGAVDRAFEYANQAFAIDKNAAVAYVVMAYAQLYGRKEPEKAITAARTAISLYPNYADAYAIIGSAYSFTDKSADAIRASLHAMRLNPTSSYLYYANLGRDYYHLREPQKAIDSLQEALFRNDNYLNAHLYLAATYASIGELDDAAWEVEQIMTLDPEFSLDYWAETQPYRSRSKLERMVSDIRKAGLNK